MTAEVNLQGNYVYYPFSGNDDDASGNDLHGSSPSGLSTPTLVADRNSNTESAYSFDGNNDVIELSSEILNGSLQGTLAAWVNFSDISQGGSGTRTIIGKGGSTDSQFGLFANNNAFIFEAYRNGSGTYLEITYNFNNEGIYDYSNGEWHHVAVTFSPTEAILYVNGEEKGRDNTTNGVYTHTSNNEVTICDWGSGQNDPFEGSIDEVFISNEGMTERSIYSLFDPTSFLTFSLPNAISTTFIENDKSDQDTIKIVMPAGAVVNGAAPTFMIPPGAEAKVEGNLQESEVTTQNFLENVTYTVGVTGGAVSQDWIVIVDTPPSITAISPNTSIVGTSLFINGSNFSADAEVYFGGVQANVTEASATSISVDVPLGVSLAPISVLSNGLYGEYSTDFNLTFDSPDLDSLLFDKEQLIDRPASSMAVRLADFDADGINDILTVSPDKISIHKFIFVPDVNNQLNIQLSPTHNFEYSVTTTKKDVEIADFNGDGFTDFAVIDQGTNLIIHLNQSSSQPFTFSDPINLGINENGGSTILKVADFNTGGRNDILVIDIDELIVFQNAGEVSGSLDFDMQTVDLTSLNMDGIMGDIYIDFKEIEIVDLDLDGKKDLLIIDNPGAAYIFRNISEPSGNSTFAAMQSISLPAEFTPLSIATTDLDGDSKADVAVMGMESVMVLPNASTGVGNISFDSPIVLSKIVEDGNISLGDVDGDGKVDLIASSRLDLVADGYRGALSMYKNTSVQGSLSFESELLFPRTDFHVEDIAIVDLDNDTRSEIIGVGADKLLILMNTKTDKELFSLDIAGQVSSTFKDAVDTDIDSVVVVMPYGTSVLALKPDFLVSPGATVSPDTTVAMDFAEPVTFTITAEDNTTKEWLVIVEAESNTWTGTSWSEGSPPTNIHNAIIAAAYNFSENGSFAANNLTVNNETALVVNGEGTLDVKGDLSNMGSLIVESGASLITYSDKTISNNIVIKRNTRYEGGKYSFVGSPMTMDENIVTSILGPIVYSYDESESYGENDGLDRWIRQNNEILIPSKGYAQANKQLIEFMGRPNDGTITIIGTYSGTPNDVINDANEGWNMISNPYPSAINVEAFLTENDNIVGAVYIWDDNGSDDERGTNSDYIVANGMAVINTAPTPAGGGGRYNSHLGSSQGFFVKLLGNGDNEIAFTESMRVPSFNSDDNFFRKSTEETPIARLNLRNTKGLFKQTVIGFIDGIDDEEMNRLYDAPIFDPAIGDGIYTIKQQTSLAIQGVSWSKEMIPLGYNVAESGQYEFQLNIEEFGGRDLYLFDEFTKELINLSIESYIFESQAGIFQNRFSLLTTQDVLVIEHAKNLIYVHENILYVRLADAEPNTILIYDLQGHLVFKERLDDSAKVDLSYLFSGVYIVKDEKGLTQKIIIK